MKTWGRRAALCALAIIAACASFETFRLVGIDFPNKSGKLKNGLRVVIQPDPSRPTVFVAMRYGVGAAEDPRDRRGIAHFIEHLAFRLDDEIVVAPKQAAPAAPAGDAPAAPVKERVVRYLVDENAYTSLDETFYHSEVVPYHLEDVLESYAKQMADFTPQISPEVFKTELEVVKNERKSRYEGDPLGGIWIDFYERFYPAGHPYQGPTAIGTPENLDAITLADVSAFLQKNYRAANATLLIVGPVEPDKTLALVAQHFGDKPAGETFARTVPTWQPTYREETVVVPKARNTLLTIAWPLGGATSDEVTAMRILDDAVGGWISYRLVTNRGWAYWAWSGVDDGESESRFVVQALLRNHDDVAKVRDKIFEIAGYLDSNITAADVAQARHRMAYSTLYAAEDRYSRAQSLAGYFAQLGQPVGWAKTFERADALDLDKVRATGSRVLAKDRAFVLVHTPVAPGSAGKEAGGASVSAQTVRDAGNAEKLHEERETLPERFEFAQPSADYLAWATTATDAATSSTDFVLSNGLRCRVRQDGALPVMGISLLATGGQVVEPEPVHGVGSVMFRTLGMSGSVSQEYRYRMNLSVSTSVDDEYVEYAQELPSFYAETGLELLGKQLDSPSFMNTSVHNARDNLVNDLEDAATDVGMLAARAYWRLRGLEKSLPYYSARTLREVSLGDVESYYEQVLYPENAVLAVVSDKPVAEVKTLLERHLAGWGAAGRAPLELPASTPAPHGERSALVSVPDSVQTTIWLAYDAPGWRDWHDVIRSNAVAKLLEHKARRVREAMGVTYGVGASNIRVRDYGTLVLSSKVQSDATNDAIRQLQSAAVELASSPVTDGDLEHVKRALLAQYAELPASNRQKADQLAERAFYARPAGYDRQVIDEVSRWTTADLAAAVQKLLGQKPSLVVAGKTPDAPALEQLGFPGGALTIVAEDLL